MDIIEKISKKGTDKEKIANQIIKNSKLPSDIFEGLKSDKAVIKYGCDKVIRLISEKDPKLLYPRFNFFVKMLDSKNNFLKWGAIIVVGNLTTVDTKNKFNKIFKKYFSSILSPDMITAANTIKSAAKIAASKPKLREKIVEELLRVEKAKYKTPECTNIAIGHTISSFDQIYGTIKDKASVNKFIKKQLKNSRKPTAKKAEKFIKKYKIIL